MREYDPLLAEEDSDDLAQVEDLFGAAAAPYLGSPGTWLAWSLLLPAAALATRAVLALGGARGVILLWSVAILALWPGAVDPLWALALATGLGNLWLFWSLRWD